MLLSMLSEDASPHIRAMHGAAFSSRQSEGDLRDFRQIFIKLSGSQAIKLPPDHHCAGGAHVMFEDENLKT